MKTSYRGYTIPPTDTSKTHLINESKSMLAFDTMQSMDMNILFPNTWTARTLSMLFYQHRVSCAIHSLTYGMFGPDYPLFITEETTLVTDIVPPYFCKLTINPQNNSDFYGEHRLYLAPTRRLSLRFHVKNHAYIG